MPGTAHEALLAGDLARTMAPMMDEVRAAPTALAPRPALFRLAAVEGRWEPASRQLQPAAGLDPETAWFVEACGGLIEAETEGAQVVAGAEAPVTMGEPPALVTMLARAVVHDAAGEREAAAVLRRLGLEVAPAAPGELDGAAFARLMDADPRFGPCLEVIVPSRYRRLPLRHLLEPCSDGPGNLEDAVWLPAMLRLAGGTELAVLLPVRDPRTEGAADGLARLDRATVFDKAGFGAGGRLLTSDAGDHPLMVVRRVRPGPAGDG